MNDPQDCGPDSSPQGQDRAAVSETQSGSDSNSPFLVHADSTNISPGPVVAEIVGDGRSTTEEFVAQSVDQRIVNVPREFQNVAAQGGAVGGVVLGIWSILGMLISPFAVINALLAIGLGAYGLFSARRKLAVAGIILGLAGLILALMDVSQTVGSMVNSPNVGGN